MSLTSARAVRGTEFLAVIADHASLLIQFESGEFFLPGLHLKL